MSKLYAPQISEKCLASMGLDEPEETMQNSIVVADLHDYIETTKQLSVIPEENDNDPPFKCCSAYYKTEIFRNLQLAIPLMLANVLQFTLIIETTAFVGRLSSVELEGTTLALSLIQAFGWFIVGGLVSACDTMISQTFGSQNKRRTGLFLQRALLMMNLIPIILYGLHVNFEPILVLLGQNQQVSRVAGIFSIYFMPGITFMLNYLLLARYMQNQNATKVPIIAALCGNVFNVIFQLIFVTYLGYGYKASAICLSLSYFIMMLIELVYIVFSKFYVPTWPGFQWEAFYDWKQMFQLGMAGICHTSFECIVWESVVFLGGWLGRTELATNSILIQILEFMFLVSFGVGCASNIRVGQYLGANQPNLARTAFRAGLTVISIVSIVMGTIFAASYKQIGYVFTNQENVVSMLRDTFPYVLVICYVDPFSAVCSGSIRGCGKQKIGAVLMFIAFYVLAIPIAILLGFVANMSIKGIWIGITVGSATSVLSNFCILECQNWHKRAEEAQKRITYSSLKAEIDVSTETTNLLPTTIEVSDEGNNEDKFNHFSQEKEKHEKPIVTQTYHVRTPSNPIFCSTEIIPIPQPKSVTPGFNSLIIMKRLITLTIVLLILIGSVLIHVFLDPSIYRFNNTVSD